MTTSLPERCRRLGRLILIALLIALLAMLAACGPGTGGTGTGPQGVFNFSGGSGAGIAPPAASCQAGCSQVALQLQEQRVELIAACRRFIAIGPWTVNADGVLVLAGTVKTASSAGTSTVPAVLRLQFSERRAALQTSRGAAHPSQAARRNAPTASGLNLAWARGNSYIGSGPHEARKELTP